MGILIRIPKLHLIKSIVREVWRTLQWYAWFWIITLFKRVVDLYRCSTNLSHVHLCEDGYVIGFLGCCPIYIVHYPAIVLVNLELNVVCARGVLLLNTKFHDVIVLVSCEWVAYFILHLFTPYRIGGLRFLSLIDFFNDPSDFF